jgi:glycerol-3-phosphate acyltransferase PlsX
MTEAREPRYTSPHEVTAQWGAIDDGRVVRVAVDAAGGDHAPEAVVEGALKVAGPSTTVVLVGDEPRIRALLPPGASHVEVVHAPDVINSHDEPVRAARAKEQSSMVVGARLVHEGGADAFVSAGNTGAMLACAMLHIRRQRGVERPAICTIMPAVPGPIALLDVGANADVRPEHLRQFALMGQIFARELMGIPEPQVGLLSIGEEPTKGSQVVLEAHKLIAADERIDFYGNLEGRDVMIRTVDVVVTDGFTGNVVLKTVEGTAKAIMKAVKAAATQNVVTKLGALTMRAELRRVRDALDPEEFGGAFLVGMSAPVVIAHGNFGPHGIANAIRQGRRGVVTGLLPTIARELGSGPEDAGAAAAADTTVMPADRDAADTGRRA